MGKLFVKKFEIVIFNMRTNIHNTKKVISYENWGSVREKQMKFDMTVFMWYLNKKIIRKKEIGYLKWEGHIHVNVIYTSLKLKQ